MSNLFIRLFDGTFRAARLGDSAAIGQMFVPAPDYEALQARVKRLEDALREQAQEAHEDINDWAGYASEYFQNKHDLMGCLEKWEKRAALAEGDKP